MATPVGPVPRDPDDPDLWEEWYSDEADDPATGASRYALPVRVLALVVVVGLVLLLIL